MSRTIVKSIARQTDPKQLAVARANCEAESARMKNAGRAMRTLKTAIIGSPLLSQGDDMKCDRLNLSPRLGRDSSWRS